MVLEPRQGEWRDLELVLHVLLFLFRLVLTCKVLSTAVANCAQCADRQKIGIMMMGDSRSMRT